MAPIVFLLLHAVAAFYFTFAMRIALNRCHFSWGLLQKLSLRMINALGVLLIHRNETEGLIALIFK